MRAILRNILSGGASQNRSMDDAIDSKKQRKTILSENDIIDDRPSSPRHPQGRSMSICATSSTLSEFQRNRSNSSYSNNSDYSPLSPQPPSLTAVSQSLSTSTGALVQHHHSDSTSQHSSSPPNNNQNVILTTTSATPRVTRRLSISNALKRLSLKRTGNNTSVSSASIGSPVMLFGDMMTQSNSMRESPPGSSLGESPNKKTPSPTSPSYSCPTMLSTTSSHPPISPPLLYPFTFGDSHNVPQSPSQPRSSGTKQVLDVLNRKKWRDLLCVTVSSPPTKSTPPPSSNDINNEPLVNHGINTDNLNLSTSSVVSGVLESFSTSSPNENIFRNVILGGFLSLKDVLCSCDLVCKSWHERISNSKENLLFFLPQLLSSISVWEEKDDLQIELATQIARSLPKLGNLTKRCIVVLFGLYKRSLHKEKIFNRAVFKEVVRPEIPELLGVTDKCNMFYKLSSPAWFSFHENSSFFDYPLYLYLSKRCLRSIEKKEGEFQQRVQVLVKIRHDYQEPAPFNTSSVLGLFTTTSPSSLSPGLSPVASGKNSLVGSLKASERFLGTSPERASDLSCVSPSTLHMLNGSFSTSTSPTGLAVPKNPLSTPTGHPPLSEAVKEIKSNWYFAFGVVDLEKSFGIEESDFSQQTNESSLPITQEGTANDHYRLDKEHPKEPRVTIEKVIKFFSHVSLAKMREDVVFSCLQASEEDESEEQTKISSLDKHTQISNKIEQCYLEMTDFTRGSMAQELCQSLELAERDTCQDFDTAFSSWICELSHLGLLHIDFILCYVAKVLYFICDGPMHDRSELQFAKCGLGEEGVDGLDTVCVSSCYHTLKETLTEWMTSYRASHQNSSIYSCYLKINYDCEGFKGAINEESYLLVLNIHQNNFEFVSYLFEKKQRKGVPLASLPLFIKKI